MRIEISRGVTAVRDSVKEKGLGATANLVAATAVGQLTFPVTKAMRQNERFLFRGEELPYTLHRYNNAYRNERTVEISIARWFLTREPNGRILEIGNVLAHYGLTGQTVLDKYETVPGVINEDIVDWTPEQKFDTVLAVSTLEHVGWDETPREPEKVFAAFEAVRSYVAPGGKLLVTCPIGHNKALDGGLRSGRIKFDEETWLVRTAKRNEWREATKDEALSREYGRPFRNANAVYVGTMNA
ncbi:hypothetical protein [Actinocrispum sp. NPDC049592]|uniref:SAM-dependent methyltransferase n=1 Tax=Actinocrispum sp. NPDC049592 TaxID=3154835 RepID=UPI003427AB9C